MYIHVQNLGLQGQGKWAKNRPKDKKYKKLRKREKNKKLNKYFNKVNGELRAS